MPRVGSDDEQVDLLRAEVVPVQLRSLAQRFRQLALDRREESLVLQRLAPKLDHQFVVIHADTPKNVPTTPVEPMANVPEIIACQRLESGDLLNA